MMADSGVMVDSGMMAENLVTETTDSTLPENRI